MATFNKDQAEALDKLRAFLSSDQRLFVLIGSAGTGKAQPLHSPILTPSGWKTMGEIKKGDSVIGGDGRPTKVIGVFPQGIKSVARVTMSDGSSTLCCYDHLWQTQTYKERANNRNRERKSKKLGYTNRYNPGTVKSTSDIAATLKAREGQTANHSIPIAPAIHFASSEVPIHPYLLGCLLGDGGMTGSSVILTTTDAEIVKWCAESCNAGVTLVPVNNQPILYKFRAAPGLVFHSGNRNPLHTCLRKLNLWGKGSLAKHIPQCYLFNSVEIRLAVLRGLMDTDGTVTADGFETCFDSSSHQLAKDVQFLIESLGGIAPMSRRVTASGNFGYRLSVCMPPELNPFRLTRKRDRVVPKTRYVPARYIVNVEPAGEAECQCISVENPSGLYLTDRCIVTHNTFLLQQFLLEQITMWGRRVAVVAPTNKAVRVLVDMSASFGSVLRDGVTYTTVHQLLGLKMRVDESTGKVDFVPDPFSPFVSDNFDIIVCDEGSMLNTELFTILLRGIRKQSKLAISGDPCQLPPVGEESSPVFAIEQQARLVQIVRHGGGIQDLVTAIRDSILQGTPMPHFRDNNDGETGVWYDTRDVWLKKMLADFTSERFKEDSNFCRALAWTNRVVEWGNTMVHEAIYGFGADCFLPGQRLVAQEPVVDEQGAVMMTTSSECTVVEASWRPYLGYTVWDLVVDTDTGKQVSVVCIDTASKDQFRADCQEMAEEARTARTGWAKKNLWKDYFKFKNSFANLQYVYFMTVHKSQGSTFERVYVAAGDIKANKNKSEMQKCLYTAFTRPSRRLVIQER